jgi:ketopantoate reductase
MRQLWAELTPWRTPPQVAAVVGDDSVMGGGCFLCSNKVSPGVIHHIDYGDVVLGEYCAQYAPYGVSTRMRQVAGDLNAAGITVKLEEDLFIARWGVGQPGYHTTRDNSMQLLVSCL